ncbi:probable histone-lysine N-methyltransferase CG1716 [Ostrinia nubilalis]|uniref:probable histone-lysine N-methyltransferase CG1716 n=1 Tax=Ostrinia nubilalis TaxID=29057 RepID=UPI003082582B
MFGAGMMGGMLGGLLEGAEFPPFCPPFPQPQPFCMPQHNIMGMGGFGMGGFVFGQQMPPYGQPPPGLEHAHPQVQMQMPGMPDPTQAVGLAMPPAGVAPASAAGAASDPTGEVVLPSMWRSAVDARGRTYYYHVKLRQPQWLPPPPPEDSEESEEEEAEQLSAIDTAIVRRQMKGKLVEGVNGIYEVIKEDPPNGLIPDHALLNMKPRKRRPGLVSERPISPRTEEDKLAGRLEVKRYKQTKEKLRRRRERLMNRVRLLAARSRGRGADSDAQVLKMVDLVDSDSESEADSEDGNEKPFTLPSSPPNDSPLAPVTAPATAPMPAPIVEPAPAPIDPDEAARRIKEQFRSSMARVMVHHLNPYRHSDAPAGRITCTADFKHLARKVRVDSCCRSRSAAAWRA